MVVVRRAQSVWYAGGMDHGRFWSIIDEARAAPGKTSSALVRALSKLPARDILAFDAWLWAYYMAIRREDLWAAVFAIRGGCSDDSFDYFRGWLIAQGEAALVAAIRDPESLAGLIGKRDPRDEGMLGAASKAYQAVAKSELPDAGSIAVPGSADWPPDRVAWGTKWNDAFYAATFPRLYKKYIAPAAARRPTGSISHERFWQLIDAAREEAATVDASTRALAAALCRCAKEEVIGFARWLESYNQALVRNDLRATAKLLLGAAEGEAFAGFRGWLIAQGAAAVHVALHDPGSLLAHVKHPPALCVAMIFVSQDAQRVHGIYLGHIDEDDREAIPDAWPADIAAPAAAVVKAKAIAAPVAPAAKRVRHAKFGEGTIVLVDTSGTEPKLVIDFAEGRKTIARRFVEDVE
jgi:hypothetical protein